jgi:hypothetical protein
MIRFCLTMTVVLAAPLLAQERLGDFEGHRDVGAVLHAGSAAFDAKAKQFTLSGSGENMWFAADAFHFAYKQATGNVALSAEVEFVGQGKNAHSKAVLMIRQSLDADSAYMDVALHGDGLTSLQYRDAKGATTREVQANVKGPVRLKIEKRGDYAFMYVAGPAGELKLAGGSGKIRLTEPFYVGLGVCSHEKDLVEKATFRNVEIGAPQPVVAGQPALYSSLETVPVPGGDRRVVHVFPELMEAPNWTPDGAALIYNSRGRLWRIPAAGGQPEQIDTGFATRCNNDHGISPDGKMLAISDQTEEKKSIIYTLPITGGTPRRVTAQGPSYWHGWSPDGKTLAYCAQRNGEFDIYTIPVEGGAETRLTTAPGLDDGPEYAPDGKYIYFNSERTGLMQIWRMKPDGSEQEQVTGDEWNNWFAHPSPDGKWIVFVSFEKDVKGHPANKDVQLRLMNLATKKITVLASLFGGQGTINTPSWSPDSKRVAFVSYQLLR